MELSREWFGCCDAELFRAVVNSLQSHVIDVPKNVLEYKNNG